MCKGLSKENALAIRAFTYFVEMKASTVITSTSSTRAMTSFTTISITPRIHVCNEVVNRYQ